MDDRWQNQFIVSAHGLYCTASVPTNSKSTNEGKCGWTTKALKYIVFGWPLATSYILKTHT